MNQPNPTDPWQACPPGTLQGMVDRSTRQRRRHVLARAGAAVLLIGGLTLGASWMTGGSVDPTVPQQNTLVNNHSIRCSEMPALLVQYVEHTLPESLQKPVEAHLAHCPACQHKLDRMRERQPGVSKRLDDSTLQVVASR